VLLLSSSLVSFIDKISFMDHVPLLIDSAIVYKNKSKSTFLNEP
jgi:hypothetical protein